MPYKVKSLIYFLCFVAASFLYYNMEQDNNTANDADTIELAQSNLDEISSSQITELADNK